MRKRVLAVLVIFALIAMPGSAYAAELTAISVENEQQKAQEELNVQPETGNEMNQESTDQGGENEAGQGDAEQGTGQGGENGAGQGDAEQGTDQGGENGAGQGDAEQGTDQGGENEAGQGDAEQGTDQGGENGAGQGDAEQGTDQGGENEAGEDSSNQGNIKDEIIQKQEEMTESIGEENGDLMEEIVEIEEEAVEVPQGISLSALEAETACRIDFCQIDSADRDNVKVQITFEEGVALPEKVYIFALSPYAESLEGYSPAAETECQAGINSYTFDVELLGETDQNRLYSRFVAAVGNGELYIPISGYSYITNPEKLAADNIAALTGVGKAGYNSKKGIQVVHNIFSDVEDLGVSHAFFNIILEDMISLTPTNCSFSYGGNTYYFNESQIADYDNLLSTLQDNGVTVTIALLNEYKSGYEFLIHPWAQQRQNAGTFGYAWNTTEQKGASYIQATLNFLASRYNGSHGLVSNWVIGNEVNDNLQYYYMGLRDKNSFVTEYYKTFRMAYNAIRSGNGSANVYIPLEPRWMTADTQKDYGGRGFLETFNNLARSEGNFDWSVAYHAYSYPLSTDSILHDGTSIADQTGKVLDAGHVTDSWDSPIVTMKNIHVLTDFMNDGNLRNTSGQVRSIILAEQGWTSVSNVGATETTQAANIALAYYKAEMNPDIDAFILRAHVDGDEGSPYYKFGLWNSSSSNYASTKKYSYNIFKYMDTKESLQVTNFAKSTLGISDWTSVVPGFDESKFSNMRSIEMAAITNLNSMSEIKNSSMIAANMQGFWENQYNTYGIGNHGQDNGNYVPKGLAVANEYAYHLSYQAIKHDFAAPLDLSTKPYLSFKMHLDTKPGSGGENDTVLTRVRVLSGKHINDSNAILNVNKDYNLSVDLSQWKYRNAIDRIEVWIKVNGQEKSYDGVMMLHDLQCSEGVGSSTALPTDDELNPESATFVFSDVPVIKGNWKYESVKYVYENGIMNGISATTRFDPDEPLNRAMFATVLYRMAGSPQTIFGDRFTDVKDGKYYSKPIIWANQQGIVSGFTDGSYGIDTNITREQIAKMLFEYAKKSGYDVSQAESLNKFTDKDEVSGWADGYMQWATAVGMISGKPNGDGSYRLDPKGQATRAECAAMLMRFQQKYK